MLVYRPFITIVWLLGLPQTFVFAKGFMSCTKGVGQCLNHSAIGHFYQYQQLGYLWFLVIEFWDLKIIYTGSPSRHVGLPIRPTTKIQDNKSNKVCLIHNYHLDLIYNWKLMPYHWNYYRIDPVSYTTQIIFYQQTKKS